ncbi:uncharacterized protein LOC143257477 isoform X3 [Tachypleus tridentatus]|uniref:uncharacterized protein LOC143257477 isoform X3 n=1 Tax=Tachypleus tridentatus TaxID=6853 RepID=UPI003FD64C70
MRARAYVVSADCTISDRLLPHPVYPYFFEYTCATFLEISSEEGFCWETETSGLKETGLSVNNQQMCTSQFRVPPTQSEHSLVRFLLARAMFNYTSVVFNTELKHIGWNQLLSPEPKY